MYICVEIRGVTSVGKDGCRYLSQFYLGDLERSWGTLIDISYQSPQVFWPLIQLLQQSAHLLHLTSCCDQLPLDGCLSVSQNQEPASKGRTLLSARVLALPCLLLIVSLHSHCGDHKAGCALCHHGYSQIFPS